MTKDCFSKSLLMNIHKTHYIYKIAVRRKCGWKKILREFSSAVPNCKVFEDNSGALELARLSKLRPRTKHINVWYHHFCEHVPKGLIKIFPIDTKDQIADALTKALAQNDFQRHRHYTCVASNLSKPPMWGSVMYLGSQPPQKPN